MSVVQRRVSVIQRSPTSFNVPGSMDPAWSTIAAMADIADEVAALRRTVALAAISQPEKLGPEVMKLIEMAHE